MNKTCCDTSDKLQSNKKAVLYRMVMDKHICPYGLKSKYLLEKHGYEVEDNHLTTREETDAFKEEHNVKTTPQTFIDGKRVGGHDDLVKFFGEQKSDILKKYQPIMAVFGVTFLMAVMVTWFAYENLFISDIVKFFVSISMRVNCYFICTIFQIIVYLF